MKLFSRRTLALALAVLSAILHFMTVNKLERKLNLA